MAIRVSVVCCVESSDKFVTSSIHMEKFQKSLQCSLLELVALYEPIDPADSEGSGRPTTVRVALDTSMPNGLKRGEVDAVFSVSWIHLTILGCMLALLGVDPFAPSLLDA